MKKILLNGADGNFGSKAADVLLEKWPHEDLIFAAPTAEGTSRYRKLGIDCRIADFNDPEGLAKTFQGADTIILISMPFVGPRRRAAHKNAIDAAVKATCVRIVYTSIVGAGEKDIDTYEVNAMYGPRPTCLSGPSIICSCAIRSMRKPWYRTM